MPEVVHSPSQYAYQLKMITGLNLIPIELRSNNAIMVANMHAQQYLTSMMSRVMLDWEDMRADRILEQWFSPQTV